MLSLGIESTAHTFGIAIMDDKGNVLANEKDLYTTEEGGLIPFKLGEHHVDVCGRILNQALNKAGLKIKNIDIISYSRSPGIGNALKVGCDVARSIHVLHKIPVIGVNHCVAHLEIGRLRTGMQDPVMLYASGANTQIIAYDGGKYRVFGESIDGGVGNFIDSFARELGLGFPGGPKVEQLALNGTNLIHLPYSVKGMDVTFGGLFTNLKQKIVSMKSSNTQNRLSSTEGGTLNDFDLAFSVQETVFAMLVEVSERAMAHCGKSELLLGGGVACNKRLQEMCGIMCKERNAKFASPENQFLVDNAAMIAWLGILQYKAQPISLTLDKIDIKPYLRTDQIEVYWR